jgi:hypothetical protein
VTTRSINGATSRAEVSALDCRHCADPIFGLPVVGFLLGRGALREVIRELSFVEAACATSWPLERRLRDLPHPREHSFGRDPCCPGARNPWSLGQLEASDEREANPRSLASPR